MLKNLQHSARKLHGKSKASIRRLFELRTVLSQLCMVGADKRLDSFDATDLERYVRERSVVVTTLHLGNGALRTALEIRGATQIGHGRKPAGGVTVRQACSDGLTPRAEKLDDGKTWAMPRIAVLRNPEVGFPPERRKTR